ncbi:hypothetical protein B0H11DRAFT_2151984 [Mycena galericulata]|nr:hypothetical protein B0H11DRAFT_1745133 [Mycena galericulata]KAJ7511558.1 hypothetical protein B0H11DRAFT_2151984 [Mycena galericulata]
MKVWAEDDLENFLDESLRGEGRGDYCGQRRCAECRVPDVQTHRCEDCFTEALFCTPCVVRLHADNPFHLIKSWDGAAFTETSLAKLGLRIQLGHRRGEPCPGTVARQSSDAAGGGKTGRETFCVVAHNAIHEVNLDFCTCGSAPLPSVQLLRARLYPATTTQPRSAASFQVLDDFHKLSFETKCSAYEFYNSLARKTNNTGNFQPRDRYSAFLRMTREWRHLKMLKRSGRGHLPGGARNIEAGACALLCPACPQPGKNLPSGGDWTRASKEKRFLYALFLALDANFRMRRKRVSSEEADPGLNNGAAFYSEVKAYMEHVGFHWELEQEKSRCVSHDAVNQPDRESRGTASSGIGTVDCARHNMKRPNAVGDLQKGERYINMDYMLWKSLKDYDELVMLIVSYDIVCQWSINIWRRLEKYGPELRERAGDPDQRYYQWLIPKFHLPAHIEACNILYSFNLTPYVGQTDGEAPERGWSNINPLATSTQEMGPGARRDVIDDHFNDWNHKKIVAMGQTFLERSQKAVGEMVEKQEALVETEASLPSENVETWTKAVELWELDPSQPNPFNVGDKHESLQAIRGRIAEEVKDAVEGDAADDVRGDLHASEMLAMGMQLEEQQRSLGLDVSALGIHATDGQKTTVLERGNKLRRKIATWIKAQTDFQPELAAHRAADEQARAAAARMQPSSGVAVQDIDLWLPSKQARSAGVRVKESHARYEFDMREGHAHEALEEIRRLLLVRTHQYKAQADIHGVAGKTRSRTSIAVVDEQIRRQAGEYRAARRAMASLSQRLKETRWMLVLKELKGEDIRGMPSSLFGDKEKRRKGKKRRKEAEAEEPPKEMSWIWRTGLASVTAAAATSEEAATLAIRESLRVEWAKARARAHRWTEEVDLLEEEMRRTLVFLDWRAGWWRGLKDLRPEVVTDEAAKEGFNAYAERQAKIQDDMKLRFEANWADVPTWIQLGRDGVAATAAAAIPDADSGEDEDEVEDESDQPVPLVARNAVAAASMVEGSLLPTA